MSALITLAIETSKSAKEVFDYLSDRFPNGIDLYESQSQGNSKKPHWDFGRWGISPTVWLKLSNLSTGKIPPERFAIAFELLDWLEGDMLLTFDSEGLLIRRGGMLIVNPITFTNPHSYLSMLEDREFVFSNCLPDLAELRFRLPSDGDPQKQQTQS